MDLEAFKVSAPPKIAATQAAAAPPKRAAAKPEKETSDLEAALRRDYDELQARRRQRERDRTAASEKAYEEAAREARELAAQNPGSSTPEERNAAWVKWVEDNADANAAARAAMDAADPDAWKRVPFWEQWKNGFNPTFDKEAFLKEPGPDDVPPEIPCDWLAGCLDDLDPTTVERITSSCRADSSPTHRGAAAAATTRICL